MLRMLFDTWNKNAHITEDTKGVFTPGDLNIFHKPTVYGAVHLLYGVAQLDSMI